MRGKACSAEFMRRLERMVEVHEGKHKVGKSMTVSISRQYIPLKSILVYNRGKQQAVIMLQAYFDESGHSSDSQFVCMGGCLAPVETWDQFEKDWGQVLLDYDLTWFHMTDFESYQGEFKGWSKGKHEQLLGRLMAIMDHHIQLYVGTSENVGEYDRQPQPRDDPYFQCLLVCLDSVASYVAQLPEEEKVQVIFADHPEFGRRVRRLYPEVREVKGMYSRLAGDSYFKAKDVYPLQAADIVAFEVRKERKRQAHGSTQPMRWPRKQLKGKAWYDHGYFQHPK